MPICVPGGLCAQLHRSELLHRPRNRAALYPRSPGIENTTGIGPPMPQSSMPNSDRFGRNHALLSGPARQWLAAGQPRFVGPQGFDDFYEDYFAGMQAPPAEPRGRTLGQMAALLWRRKYLVLGVMLACGLVAYTVSYLVTPRYTAEGVLAVQNQPLYFAQLGTPNPPNAMDPSIPRSEAQILNSRSL